MQWSKIDCRYWLPRYTAGRHPGDRPDAGGHPARGGEADSQVQGGPQRGVEAAQKERPCWGVVGCSRYSPGKLIDMKRVVFILNWGKLLWFYRVFMSWNFCQIQSAVNVQAEEPTRIEADDNEVELLKV